MPTNLRVRLHAADDRRIIVGSGAVPPEVEGPGVQMDI